MDGLMTYGQSQRGPEVGQYLQVMRDGRVECMSDRIAADREPTNQNSIARYMPSQHFEIVIVWYMRRILLNLRTMHVPLPLTVFLSMLNMRGVELSSDARWHSPLLTQSPVIQVDDIYLPDIVVDDYDVDIPTKLKDSLDIIWNAAGHLESRNYENGIWKLKIY